MTPWTEIDHAGERVRYRHDGREHAHPPAGYEVEHWHPLRHEWCPVRNWSSRDWFVLGLEAGRREVEAPLEPVAAKGGELATISGPLFDLPSTRDINHASLEERRRRLGAEVKG